MATLAAFLVFGALAGMDMGRIEQGDSTPWLGVTERVDAGVYLVWLIVLAAALLRLRPGANGSVTDRRPHARGRTMLYS